MAHDGESSNPIEAYSLWVTPRGALYDSLQSEIDYLREKYGGPKFEPHVTVVPAIKAPKGSVLEVVQELAGKMKVRDLPLAVWR